MIQIYLNILYDFNLDFDIFFKPDQGRMSYVVFSFDT